jgi:hypothetical protein
MRSRLSAAAGQSNAKVKSKKAEGKSDKVAL